MSETKVERTLDQVRQEYSNLAAKAGHTQYQIAELTSDLKVINEQLRDLNFEAGKLIEAVKEEQKAVTVLKAV